MGKKEKRKCIRSQIHTHTHTYTLLKTFTVFFT